jgi:hypothetical protein
LGLRVNVEGEDLIKNKELTKQVIAIQGLGPNVKIKIID